MTGNALIIGISGASGMPYAVRALEILRELNIETHLVMSKAAELTLDQETHHRADYLRSLASEVHNNKNIGASIASGSFKTRGMLVLPCSVKTMSEIAYGLGGNLISRAADVVLKERRRLVLAVREMPLHTGHLRTMTQLSEMGAIVAPPCPAFYPKPKDLETLVDQVVGRYLDLFDIDYAGTLRWQGLNSVD